MFYKNCSCTVKTFYGVTFKPGETKQVDSIINDKWLVPVNDVTTTALKSTQQKPSPEQPKEVPALQPIEPDMVKTSEDKTEEKQGKGKKS